MIKFRLVLFGIALSASLIGQNELFQQPVTWMQFDSQAGWPLPPPAILQFLFSQEIEIVGGVEYIPIHRSSHWTEVEVSGGNVTYQDYSTSPELYVYVRSSEHAIYARLPGVNQEEVLLFDADKQPGDTLDIHFIVEDWEDQSFVVTSRDSVLIGEQWRIVLEYGYGFDGTLIEGIGTLNGIFSFPQVGFGFATILECYTYGTLGISFGGNNFPPIEVVPTNESCNPVSVSEVENLAFSLYPNPTQTEIRVESPYGQLDYTILTATGVLVQSGRITEHSQWVDVSGLAQGYYIMVVGSGRRPFVVNHN
jgi:hypothetical protein